MGRGLAIVLEVASLRLLPRVSRSIFNIPAPNMYSIWPSPITTRTQQQNPRTVPWGGFNWLPGTHINTAITIHFTQPRRFFLSFSKS